MHYFVYPKQDSYITNNPNFEDKNFGLDEILMVGTDNISTVVDYTTKTYYYETRITYYYEWY